jgi:hypothetical protein
LRLQSAAPAPRAAARDRSFPTARHRDRAITLTILPAILMYLAAQRYIVAGLTAGAVKA